MALTREDILNADDIERDTVDVPEWGGEVIVRCLNAEEYIDMGFDLQTDEDTIDPEKAKELMPRIVSMGIVDEDGRRIFTETDIEAIAQKSFGPVNRVSTRILELSGLAEGVTEETKN